MFEITKLAYVKADENGDDLAIAHTTFTITFGVGIVRIQEEFGSVFLKFFAEIVSNTENFRNFIAC